MVGAAPDASHLMAVGLGFGALALLTAMAMKRHTRYLALKVLT